MSGDPPARWRAHVLAAGLLLALGAGQEVGAQVLVLTSTPQEDAQVGSPYVYTMSATLLGGGDDDDDDDDDEGELEFFVDTLPGWLAFDDAATIAGTPDPEDVGIHPVTVGVRFESLQTTQAFAIDVAPIPNSAPQHDGPIPPQTAVEGEGFVFDASGYFSDADVDDVLTYDAEGEPIWISIDGASGVVSGTPPAGASADSPFGFVIVASDGEQRAEGGFTLHVDAANRPPVSVPIEPDPQEVTAGDEYRFDSGQFFSDPDGGPLSFSADRLPASLTIAPDSGVISGTPTAGDAGTFVITVIATDGALDAQSSYTLRIVLGNRQPVLDEPIEPDPQTVDVGEPYGFDAGAFFSDPDGDALSFGASGLPPSLTIAADTGVISGTPQEADEGGHAIRVTASDGNNGSAFDEFTLNVVAADEPPTLPDPPPALSTPEDTPLEITPALLDAQDEEPNALSVLLSAPGPDDDFTLDRDGTRVVPAQDFNGILTVEARVRDASATSNAVSVTIDVTPVNDAPRIGSVPRQTATEASSFTLDLREFVSDAEDDPLTFRAAGLPPGLAIDVATGVISGTPPAGTEGGDYNVSLTVNDGSESARSDFTIAVVGAGRADLEASLAVLPNPVLIGETATFTLGAVNNAEVGIGNLTLDASFSGDALFELDPISDAACTVEAGANEIVVHCAWGPLAGGETRTVEVTGRASQAGDVFASVAVAIVDATPLDETPGNDETGATLIISESLAGGAAQELAAPGARAVAAADYDGDGLEDLAVATAGDEPTLVFLNGVDPDNGTKLVFAAVPISAGGPSDAADIAAADLDGDGDIDLAVAHTDGNHTLLVNEGSASFAEAGLASGAAGATRVVVADVNGDALPDVVFAGEGSNAVYTNQGGLQFALTNDLGGPPGADVLVADLGGDALPELVVANQEGNATLYSAVNGAYAATSLETGPATSIATGDFDGDGDGDLVFGRRGAGNAGTDIVLLNASSSRLSFLLADEIGGAPTVDALAGDFDLDGLDDIVAINAVGSHQLYTNSGSANTTFLLHPQQFVSAGALRATIGKLNSDDRIDVAVVGNDVVTLFFNDGRGNLGRGDEDEPTLSLVGEPTVTVVVGDPYEDAGATASDEVDGDLTPEVVVENPVDTDLIGSYTVTYDVTDSSGNEAPTLSRTVEVRAREAGGGGGGGSTAPAALLALLGLAIAASRRRGLRHGSRAIRGKYRSTTI